MTLLVVQIPCLNEAQTLPRVIAGIPRDVPGVERVEILVVDDGSTDGTDAVARELGVDHVVRNGSNLGLARSFAIGLDACLARGADIVVNLDGDDQYPGHFIPALVAPLLEGRADICIADRRTATIAHFSPAKRLLQRWGSRVVRSLSGVDVPDAVSGFRAMTRDAALSLSILSTFSYTIEMLIQAGNLRLRVTHVPIEVNPRTRPSRLFRSNRQFIGQAAATMLRAYMMYRPLRTFLSIGLVFFLLGAVPIVRFFYFYAIGEGDGHVQSLILGSLLVNLGVLSTLLALVSDIVARNRMLLHDVLRRVRSEELDRLAERPAREHIR